MSESGPVEPCRPEPGRPDDAPRAATPPPPPPPCAACGDGYGTGVQRHPQATTVLVLGLVSGLLGWGG